MLALIGHIPSVTATAYTALALDCVGFWAEWDAAANETEQLAIQRRFLLAHGGRLIKRGGEVILVGGMYCPRV